VDVKAGEKHGEEGEEKNRESPPSAQMSEERGDGAAHGRR
jgi:hypothetical protein